MQRKSERMSVVSVMMHEDRVAEEWDNRRSREFCYWLVHVKNTYLGSHGHLFSYCDLMVLFQFTYFEFSVCIKDW